MMFVRLGFLFGLLFLPVFAVLAGDILQILFTNEPWTVIPNQAVMLTIQVQYSGSSHSTVCMKMFTDSSTGQFSSSDTNWSSVDKLTINSNWNNKNFYYRDLTEGDYTLTVEVFPVSCSVLTDEEAQWVVNQKIIVSGEELPSNDVEVFDIESFVTDPDGPDYVQPENKPNITAYAGKDRTMIAGASGEFRGEAYGLEKTPLANARYLWNFGDGVIKEGQNVNHFYRYVGEYTVYLDVSSGGYSSSDALVVKVIPNEIFISEVKTGTDGFIELYNNSKNEINISGWRFRQGSQTFTFSNNSFIRPNSYLVIPISSSGLLLTYEKGKTELLYPGSFLADEFNYSGILKEGESYSRIMENKSTDSFVGKETPGVKNSSQISNSPASTSRGEAGKVQISNQNQISKDLSYDSPVVDEVVVNKQNIEVGLEEEGKKNLEANVIAATEADEGKLYYYFLAVLGLSLFSGVGVYLVRRQGGI